MTSVPASSILSDLQLVAAERRRGEANPPLGLRVREIKRYQQARFRRTYADLMSQPRYATACRFFLDELYGPADFHERDAQFERVVPALVRLFPGEIVSTVASLARLHALSETLDRRMGESLPDGPIDRRLYATAWQATGEPQLRATQVVLMRDIGQALERHTGRAMLRHSLRLMRGPARAAGLSRLQDFLERGVDAFRSMRGSHMFLATIAEREQSLADALFDLDVAVLAGDCAWPTQGRLGELP